MKRSLSLLALVISVAPLSAAPTLKRTSSVRPTVPLRAALLAPQSDLLTLVNQFRQSQGVGPLTENGQLDAAASAYAIILATQAEFSHQVGGTTATGRVQAAGYRGGYVGENIARGFFDAASVETAWQNSPGHRINLLDPNFTEIGLGIANGPFGQSWVQDFGRVGVPPVTPAPIPVPVPVPVPPIVPPTTPAPAPPVVTLIGSFQLFKDNLGNYYLLPLK